MPANRLSFNFLCPSNSHNKYTYKEIESKQKIEVKEEVSATLSEYY